MPISIYYIDCILQGSKFINVTAFRMVNIYLCLLLGNLHTNKSIDAFSSTCIWLLIFLVVMHKWAWVMAVSLNYCTPLHLSVKFCNRFNRQKQENNKIKFWKSVPSYVLVRKYQWRKKIIFIPCHKWENLKNVLFYGQQIAHTIFKNELRCKFILTFHIIIKNPSKLQSVLTLQYSIVSHSGQA